MDAQSQFLTAREVAQILGISEWSVYEQQKRGALPVQGVRVGRSLRWPRVPFERLANGEPVTQSAAVSPDAVDG